jgi:hypothetical protein
MEKRAKRRGTRQGLPGRQSYDGIRCISDGMIAPVSPCTRNYYKRFEEEDRGAMEVPRRFRHRREGVAAQEGCNLRSDRWIFIRFGCYLFYFFLNRFFLS